MGNFERAVCSTTSANAIASGTRPVSARWWACWADAGFSYAGPWAANTDSHWREDIVTDQERLVATADVTCKLETNLIGIWNAVDAAYQERIIERDAELLAEMVEDRRQLIDRAAEIVGNSR